jgi:ComF family protein
MGPIERLLALIAPHLCVSCGAEGALLCLDCAVNLMPVPSRCYRCGRVTDDFRTCPACRASSDLFAVRPVTVYEGAAKDVVHKLKFERARAAAIDIAYTIVLGAAVPEDVVICHVPTADARVRERGYDQAALIARQLSRLTGRPYAPLLLRTGQQRQVGKQRTTRREQMKDAFRTIAMPVPPPHVLLVDDVLTTGATCEAAARTLRHAGVKRVSAVVFAVV